MDAVRWVVHGMGASMSYGLGSENRDVPSFLVLNGGLVPPGGLDCFGSGFLPATHQGSIFKPDDHPVANITRTEDSEARQRRKLELDHVQAVIDILAESSGRHFVFEPSIRCSYYSGINADVGISTHSADFTLLQRAE